MNKFEEDFTCLREHIVFDLSKTMVQWPIAIQDEVRDGLKKSVENIFRQVQKNCLDKRRVRKVIDSELRQAETTDEARICMAIKEALGL